MSTLNWVGCAFGGLTLLINTCIITGLYLTGNDVFTSYGLAFNLFAVPINFIVFIVIMVLKLNDKNQKVLLGSMSILFNLPAGILYLITAFILLNHYRVTVTNDTDTPIENCSFLGCDQHFIGTLEPNETENVWISITSDCSLDFYYKNAEGYFKQLEIEGYLTPGMGGRRSIMVSELD